ncbi:MAG: hypothetical protein KKH98_15565, partial [Spirochaetes bacterium]|nr:hypothetical protein [Spirochaetota bacterium]
MKKYMVIVFTFGCLLFTGAQNLRSAEITFDFNSDNNITYDNKIVEIFQGQLRLAPTGFWTNTGSLAFSTLPVVLLQNSQGDLLYTTTVMGPGGCTYRSTDHGTNWINTGGGQIVTMIEACDTNLYGGVNGNDGGGVRISSNYGSSWTNILTTNTWSGGGFIFQDSSCRIYDWAVIGSFAINTNTLYRSDDFGNSWDRVFFGSSWIGLCGYEPRS